AVVHIYKDRKYHIMGPVFILIILLFIGVVLGAVLLLSLQRIPEYERIAVFSLIEGKFKGIKGPGLVVVNPLTEIAWRERIDLREREIRRERMHCITKDSVPINIMPIVFFKVVEPEKTVLTVVDAEGSILDLTKTTLRAVIGEMNLSEVIAKREQIVQELKKRLSKEADRWGIDITTVEIAELTPLGRVSEAMVERKTMIEDAEAKKRSLILKAEGEREAAKAEADSLLIRAEAEKRAMILRAEGEREAMMLRGEGVSMYYQKIARLGVKNANVALKYENVEALKKFASSDTPKLVMMPIGVHLIAETGTTAAGNIGNITETTEMKGEGKGKEEREGESEQH
ncbi:hypothetical protein DRN79_04075, partial [Methanosarcinales archaeon]